MNDDLIRVAWLLVGSAVADDADVRSRRAVSTAYYALFHALASSHADVMVGTGVADQNWLRVYRSLDHAAAKRVLSHLSAVAPPMLIFASAFVELQEKRHAADYDPSIVFDLDGSRLFVIQATQANHQFKLLSREDRVDLATRMLFKIRP